MHAGSGNSFQRGRSMKKLALSLATVVAFGALLTTPAYANGSGGGGFLCGLPIIGKLLCPPPPGGGAGGGGGTSVPEPATLAVLGAGAAAAIAARRRRRAKK